MMNRKDTSLLVESWRKFINESNMNMHLHEFLRDSVLKKCNEIWQNPCRFINAQNSIHIEHQSGGYIMCGEEKICSVHGNTFTIDGLYKGKNTGDYKKLLSWMKEECGILTNEKICDGVVSVRSGVQVDLVKDGEWKY